MEKSDPEEKILSYNDVVLRRSDLDILSGPCFLNDRIIEFYFSYLPTIYPSEEILLVPPSISFWIANCSDVFTRSDFVRPLNLANKELILFPVNDNDDMGAAEGGSHWSLLAFDRNYNVFVHHDSYKGYNARHAKRLYDAVVGYVATADSWTTCKYVECPEFPQQANGYDCGLYTLATAKVICGWYKGDEVDLWYNMVNEKVDSVVVDEMRGEILKLIRSVMDSK